MIIILMMMMLIFSMMIFAVGGIMGLLFLNVIQESLLELQRLEQYSDNSAIKQTSINRIMKCMLYVINL